MSYWSVGTLFWKLSIDNNMEVRVTFTLFFFHDRVNIRIYIQTGVCVVVNFLSEVILLFFCFSVISIHNLLYPETKKKTKITWDKTLTTTYALTDDIAQPKFLGCIDNQILIHMVLCNTLQVQELCYQCYKI